MGGADQQVAARRGQELPPGRLDPEPEQPERGRTGRPGAGSGTGARPAPPARARARRGPPARRRGATGRAPRARAARAAAAGEPRRPERPPVRQAVRRPARLRLRCRVRRRRLRRHLPRPRRRPGVAVAGSVSARRPSAASSVSVLGVVVGARPRRRRSASSSPRRPRPVRPRRPRSTPRRRGAPPPVAAGRPIARRPRPAGGARPAAPARPTITASDTIIAVGIPKKVQLSMRRVSSANRTAAYQMKKMRSRSPGRIRLPHRRAIQSSVTAPRTPLSDSYRNSGWNPVVASGYSVHGYCGSAVGAVDRDAPRQVGRRPVQLLVEEVAEAAEGLHHEQAGRDHVRPLRERLVPAARDVPGGDRAGDDPAVDPQPRVRRQEDLDRVVLVERPLVDDVVQPAADQRRRRRR